MNAMGKNGYWLVLSIFLCMNSAFAADSIESSITEIAEKIVKDKERIAPKSRLRSSFFFRAREKWEVASSLVLYMYTRNYMESKNEWNDIAPTIDFIDIKFE